MLKTEPWNNFKKNFINLEELGISIDTSKMNMPKSITPDKVKLFKKAFQNMKELESGSLANHDENEMVGHYWLRDTSITSSLEIQKKIENSIIKIKQFSSGIHQGKIKPQKFSYFQNLLLIGIGGSILGTQLLQNALIFEKASMQFYFLDNTDPDGIDLVLKKIGKELEQTLTIIISKSGKTTETMNTMYEVRRSYSKLGLDFTKHAVAITNENSRLSTLANREKWLDSFTIWKWIGGRTSIFSAVGLLPAALLGLDINKLLDGAKKMDEITRFSKIENNPAALLAWTWYHAGEGKGKKDMVILPYKDRLIFLSRYLQQLIMESLGKQNNVEGTKINHGLTVYGNKGSTDQHALLQQLIEGPANFFVTFIEVMKDRESISIEVERGVTSGDFLQAFLIGTQNILFQRGRQSICITIEEINELTLASLIALYERAVGIYAFLIGINAYNQPGVEAGKKLTKDIIKLLLKIQKHLKAFPQKQFTASELSDELGVQENTETIFRLLLRLSKNGRVKKIIHKNVFSCRFQAN